MLSLSKHEGNALFQRGVEQFDQLLERPFRLKLVVDRLVRHRPTMLGTLIHLALERAMPGAQRVFQGRDLPGRAVPSSTAWPKYSRAFTLGITVCGLPGLPVTKKPP